MHGDCWFQGCHACCMISGLQKAHSEGFVMAHLVKVQRCLGIAGPCDVFIMSPVVAD